MRDRLWRFRDPEDFRVVIDRMVALKAVCLPSPLRNREITRLRPVRALLVYIATEILKSIGEVVPFGVFVGKSDNVPTRNVTELS